MTLISNVTTETFKDKKLFYLDTLSYPNAQLTTVYNIETMKFDGIERN